MIARTVPLPLFIAAVVVLVAGGPVMLFPDIVPDAIRTSWVTALTLGALALGVALLRPKGLLAAALAVFLLATVASWYATPGHDLVGLRHFAGIGVGVLTMACVAAWCNTGKRLMLAGVCFALGTLVVLSLGSAGTIINFKKFVGATEMKPAPVGLPSTKLNLPGLEHSGHVNPNALAGTAVMVLPMCLGLASADLLVGRYRGAILLTGATASLAAAAVLAMTLSRMALVAALLTFVVFGLRRSRRPFATFILLLLIAATLGYGVHRWRATAPEDFEVATLSVRDRADIWRDAYDRIVEDPWLGVGINQFHQGPRLSGFYGVVRVPHAHNMFIQVVLDIGIPGMLGYVVLIGCLLQAADRTARSGGEAGRLAAGAGLSLLAAHLFGLGDAIALGAKVGLFQWFCTGIILAAAHLTPVVHRRPDASATGLSEPQR